ncbi:MAG: VPLPA-CTERM sorting domain-containing protein [Desulfobaccales bacterium]
MRSGLPARVRPTPLPASAWLFLSGLAGLGLLGRGRKEKNN